MPTEEGGLLLDLHTNTYYSLNHTALGILNALAGGQGADGCVSALVEQYGLPLEQAANAVEAFLEQLSRASLLENSS
jgi:uncharacterized protein YdaL